MRRATLLFIVAASTVSATFGVVIPEPTVLADKVYAHPDLHVGSYAMNLTEAATRGERSAVDALALLGADAASARIDPRTGRFMTLLPRVPMIPGDGIGNTLSWAVAPADGSAIESATLEAMDRWLIDNAGLLDIDVRELAARRATAFGTGDLVQVWIGREVDGVPVRDSYLTASISHGNLVLFGLWQWGEVIGSGTPGLSAAAAEAALQQHLGEVVPAGSQRRPHLEWIAMARGSDARTVAIGQGIEFRLAWVLRPDFPTIVGEWEALVDASHGEILAFRDIANYASTRTVQGGAYAVSNDGAVPDGIEVTAPMPYAFVENAGTTYTTDAGGNLNVCLDGTISAGPLAGPYFTMIDDCGAFSQSSAGSTLDFGSSAGTNCAVPGGASAGNTHASRTGFFELNRMAEMARAHLPANPWLQAPLTSQMNILDTCNATGGPGGLRFYQSGGGCFNTGEIAGIFDHEWGHGMDGSDNVPTISNPGEGIADTYASLRLNTSCIGRHFQSGNCGGYGNACLACSGVRDIDWAKHTLNTPIVITGTGGVAIENCGSGDSAPCGGSVHCEGQVYSQAIYDFWNRDLVTAGMSLDSARELATRVTFKSATNVGTWFTCTDPAGSNNATGDGCNANGGYLNYLAGDDDDGSLTNGTPHMNELFAAFNRHGIACPTPTVQESGCVGTPILSTTLTANPIDQGAALSWTSVAGATAYRVLRTDSPQPVVSPPHAGFGCDFGKAWVAETTALTFNDTGLKNGRTYSYQVVPMGPTDTCYGVASACQSVVPVVGTPNPAVEAQTVPGSTAALAQAGDGDASVDNCEPVKLTFEIDNPGGVAHTNVRITGVSIDTGAVTALESLPKLVTSNLAPACGSPAHAQLYVRLTGLTTDAHPVLTVTWTSDQLVSPKTAEIVLSNATEYDFAAPATVTWGFESNTQGWSVLSGTFNRQTGEGAPGSTTAHMHSSANLGDQCDIVRSPPFVLGTTSTMSMFTRHAIEGFFAGGGVWYDRANVGVVDMAAGGTRSVVAPNSGRTYQASGINGTCGTDGQPGWAGTEATWASSGFDAGALGSASRAGKAVRLDVRYGTDPLEHPDGLRFDLVTVTNARLSSPDVQSNTCGVSGFIFADSFETGNTSAWTATVP